MQTSLEFKTENTNTITKKSMNELQKSKESNSSILLKTLDLI